MRSADEDTQDFKRVGVNLWHAYKMKLISKEGHINTNYSIYTYEGFPSRVKFN